VVKKTHKIPVLFRPPLYYELDIYTADKRITHDPRKREFEEYTIIILNT